MVHPAKLRHRSLIPHHRPATLRHKHPSPIPHLHPAKLRPKHRSLISAHPSLITNPQTPKTHLSDRQPCTDEYRLSSDLNNRPQAMPQRRCHLDRSLASLSRRHHLRPILFLTHPRPISLPSLKTDLSFPQSLNFSILSLIFLLLWWWCGWWCFSGFCVVWWWVFCG